MYETEEPNSCNYPCMITLEMMIDYKGRLVTISQECPDEGCYLITEDAGEYLWSIGMFDQPHKDTSDKPVISEDEWNKLMGVGE